MKKSRLISIRCRHLLSCMCFVLILSPMPAFAAIVTANFTATVIGDAPFTGNIYFGTFSYDDAVLTGAGPETLDPVSGNVTVAFTFEGQAFDETNDSDFNTFPQLEFIDGVPVYIDYLLVEGASGVDFNDPTLASFEFDSFLDPDGAGGFTVDAFVAVVPVPAACRLAFQLRSVRYDRDSQKKENSLNVKVQSRETAALETV